MDDARLYDYLIVAKNRKALLVLTFDDADQYALDDVDLCFSIGRNGSRETEPLLVAFDNCINESNKRLQAYQDGELKTAGVVWTSLEPVVPVNMAYTVENVVAVWDEENDYFVFHRNPS